MTRPATTADVGHIVRFYQNGWRFGRLVSIEKKKTAVIQSPPIPGKHCVKISLADVEAAEDERPAPQMVPSENAFPLVAQGVLFP